MNCSHFLYLVLFIALVTGNSSAGIAAEDVNRASHGESRCFFALPPLLFFDDNTTKRVFEADRDYSLSQNSSYDEGIELTPLTRSLLIPGWGQVSEGKTIKGSIFFGISLVAIAIAVHNNNLANDSWDRYRTETDPAMIQHYRRDTERLDEKRNQAIIAAVANHVLNVLDILFTGEEDSTVGLGLSMGPPPLTDEDASPAGFSLFCSLTF